MEQSHAVWAEAAGVLIAALASGKRYSHLLSQFGLFLVNFFTIGSAVAMVKDAVI